MLRRVAFIGVTGSSGKTMTKEPIAAVFSTRLNGHKSLLGFNDPRFTVQAILQTRPWHDFCVIEIAGNIPRAPLALGQTPDRRPHQHRQRA